VCVRAAAEVDAFDSHSFVHHRLAGRVRAERRDALLLAEQLAQTLVERRRRLARHGVVVGDRATLLDDLARRVQTRRAREARTLEPLLGLSDLLLESSHVGAPAHVVSWKP
jgi:hypothetical protein